MSRKADDDVWSDFEVVLDRCGYIDVAAVKYALAEAGLTVVRVDTDPARTSDLIAKAFKSGGKRAS